MKAMTNQAKIDMKYQIALDMESSDDMISFSEVVQDLMKSAVSQTRM